jgi:hypothetical protein
MSLKLRRTAAANSDETGDIPQLAGQALTRTIIST